jgi:hypothetical protein
MNNRNPSPEFRDDSYEEIIKWADANVTYADEVKVGSGERVKAPQLASWGFVWEHGGITWSSLKSKENDETKAKIATALCIYLWTRGVAINVAISCAELYAKATITNPK